MHVAHRDESLISEEERRELLKRVYDFLGGGVREVRAIRFVGEGGDKEVVARFFVADGDSFADRILKLYDREDAPDQVYVSLNPRRGEGRGDELSVPTVTTILIDIDAWRPDKTVQGATKEELKKALEVTNEILEWFDRQGFLRPLVVFSGNGFQLWCSVYIEVTEENRETVKRQLRLFNKFIKRKFSKPGVAEIDSTCDLARMVGVPYTMNRKPRVTPDRPARMRRVENDYIPERIPDRRLVEFIMSLEPFEEAAAGGFVKALKRIPPEVGIRSDWLFAATIYFKLLGYGPEKAFKALQEIPVCASKLRDRDYSWWLDYEWKAVESPSVEGLIGAVESAQNETGVKLFESREQLLEALAEDLSPDGVVRTEVQGLTMCIRPVKGGLVVWFESPEGERLTAGIKVKRLVNIVHDERNRRLLKRLLGGEVVEALEKALGRVEELVEARRNLYAAWKRARKYVAEAEGGEEGPAVEDVEVPPERIEEIARDPAFIYKLGKAIEAAGVEGEEENKRLLWLIVVSGQTRDPRSAVPEGPSRSGKNYDVSRVLIFIPEEWYFEFTTATPEAIKYLPEDFEGTLVIYEAAGVRSQTGALGLRAIGEGRQIVTIYPVRDEETGQIRLEMHRTGARNFIATTTAVDIDPELLGRTIIISTDYSKELTDRVLDRQLRDAALKPILEAAGISPYTELKPEEVKAFLRSLDLKLPVAVFAPNIGPMFKHLPPELYVTLREHNKTVLGITRVLALVRQRIRPVIEVGDKKVVLALPQDFLDAWMLVGGRIAKTVERMSRRAETVLKLAEELDKDGSGFTVRDITSRTGMPRSTAARILDQLLSMGFLSVEKSPGKANVYHFEKKAQTPAQFEMVRLAVSAFEKGLETLLSKGCSGVQERGIPLCVRVPPEADLDVWVHPITGRGERLPVSEILERFVEALEDTREEATHTHAHRDIPLSWAPEHPPENREKSVEEEEGQKHLTTPDWAGVLASLAGPTLGECERAVLNLMHRKRLEGVEWLYEHEIMESLGDRFGELLIRGALDALVKAGKLIREETPTGVRYRLAE